MNDERKKELLCELKELCSIFGPSGLEFKVRDYVRAVLEGLKIEGAQILEDKLGGIYLRIKNEGAPRLLLSAHMDEVGFMVTEICEDGALKIGAVGGINPLVLCSKRIVSENGVYGIISSKPIHLQGAEERKARTEIEKMRVCIGAKSRQEAMEYVSIGDYFTFADDFCELGDCVASKAIDDRHGVSALLYIARELARTGAKSNYELCLAFTCREEIGVSGAWCATELIKPQLAIVVESKAVSDLPSVSDTDAVGTLGDGALISFADNGAIMDKELSDSLISVCKKNDIKYQISRAVSGGNDSSALQKGAYGAKVALISAPSRYIHSSANVINMSDLEGICEALYAFVTGGQE